MLFVLFHGLSGGKAQAYVADAASYLQSERTVKCDSYLKEME